MIKLFKVFSKILYKILGMIPFYRYPITRRGFKRFYKLVATLTGRDISDPKVRFSSGPEKILEKLEETGFFVANPQDYSIQFQEALKKAMSAASRLIDDDVSKLVGGKKVPFASGPRKSTEDRSSNHV